MKAKTYSTGCHQTERGCHRAAGFLALLLLYTGAAAHAGLQAYDAAITADTAAGLNPVARLTNSVALTGTNGLPFEFGASSGEVTIEFILEGNPTATTISAYLAVGETPASSLRYEQYNNTGQLGFTQAGVADYQFNPGVPSPAQPAHVAFVWSPSELTMRVYVNGLLASMASDVTDAFVMPTGAGTLGATAAGAEAMIGTIHRVTVYDEMEPEEAILRHAQAFKEEFNPALNAYDAAIAADSLAPVAVLTNAVILAGTGGKDFDFGFSSGDVTMEFIVEGDSIATGQSGFLAVGENTGSSLRYEQWDNTARLGFTQGGVADYLFVPAVASPTRPPTHIAYVWNAADFSMKLYVNGALASSVTGVSDLFAMPTGLGFLGANPTGGEAMLGTIYRVTVYDEILTDQAIQRHADAFTSVLRPAIILSFTATPESLLGQGSSELRWQVRYADAAFLDNTVVTGVTNLVVSPLFTTTYRLAASNQVSVATALVTVTVNPVLDPYDAAIAADAAGGLTPVASLTNAATLSGSTGVPFDFGSNSGDVTMEFILEGDPAMVSGTSTLAVGENNSSTLRYDQWQDTGEMGFTQAGVRDYQFTPPVIAPKIPTHLAYVWNATALTMQLYVNGILGGTVTGVSDLFVMPAGVGTLGGGMVGRIHRVHLYDELLPEATIRRHADAFTSVLQPPIIASFTANPNLIVGQGSSVLSWSVQNATAVLLNNVDVAGATSQTVSPAMTTTYSLVASNRIASITNRVTVIVDPVLDRYDAAIAADVAAGLAPVASLTNAVTLTGGGGVPFDFGPTFGDVSIEFVLSGDPIATGRSGYLAVGEIPGSNLRYDQWDDTAQMGFTELGVADYLFTPAVSSPTLPTQVTFVWNTADLSLKLYVNGALAGTANNVQSSFTMPSGMGFLGANPGGGEAMVGRINRVHVYSGVLPDEVIQRHGAAFASLSSRPELAIHLSGANAVITLEGIAGTHYRVEYRDSLSSADNWQLLEDIPSLSGTSVQVTDPTPVTGSAQRFYRAAVVP